jgi:hypothetical protein
MRVQDKISPCGEGIQKISGHKKCGYYTYTLKLRLKLINLHFADLLVKMGNTLRTLPQTRGRHKSGQIHTSISDF